MNVAAKLSALLQRPDLWRGDALARTAQEGVPSGFAELDAALPGGGWPRGALTELMYQEPGIGEVSLLLPALADLPAEAGWIALVAPPWLPHAPAWQVVDLLRLLVVRADRQETAWTCEQLLASGSLAARQASPAPLRLTLAAGDQGLEVNILKRRGPPLSRPLSLAVPRPLAWSRLGGREGSAVAPPEGLAQPA